MAKTLCILGRQPALGLAELESLYGSAALQPVGDRAVIVDTESQQIDINKLGGTYKICKLLTPLDFSDWPKISDYLIEHVPKHVYRIGPGKLTFGISTYGLRVNKKSIERTGLSVKKAVKATERPVRLVLGNDTELNSAQVIHNKMTGPLGMELILIQDNRTVWLAQTTAVQDIEAYAARDQARPKRDARVGMLPPKLAQIIVNLAAQKHRSNDLNQVITVLDPFCGTGVMLQEALLMGHQAYGTDLEPRMIEYSQTNLDWLGAKYQLPPNYRLEQGDATSYQWQPPFDAVACETYLGRPFSAPPDPQTLRQVMQDVDTIHKKFLRNIQPQLRPGTWLCLAIPAWRIGRQFEHLKTLDSLEELGYTRISFVHSAFNDLIYYREGQIVGRELVILRRK